MRIRCEKGELHGAITMAQRAVSGRSTLPILNNILFEADDRLTLVAYDLEFGIRARIRVSIEEEGAITLPARVLAEVVGALPEAEVTLTTDEHHLATVQCGASEYSIHGLPADEFPRLPLMADGATAGIQREALRQVLRSTAFATSVDETRPILTGALVQLDGDAITVVATDTHRMAYYRTTLSEPASCEGYAIIPGRVCTELLRALGSVEDKACKIALSETQAMVQVGEVTVQSRLIEGAFPKWERFLAGERTSAVTVGREELRTAVKRAAIVARQEANKVVLACTRDGLIVTADSQEIGKAREDLPAQLEGDALVIGFNSRYLLDALNALEGEEVRIGLQGPVEPALLEAVGDGRCLQVLMPMQLT